MSQEGRCYDIFGPQLFLETGSNEVGTPGRTAYTLQSINSSGDKYNQGLYESGLSRHYAEKSLQVECGIKNSNEQDSYALIAHKGNVNINSEAGWIRVKGQNIVIDAADQLVLQGRRIRIGFEEEGRTSEVTINGEEVNINAKGGNIGDLLKTSNVFLAFQNSYVSDLVKGLSGLSGIV